MNNKNITEKEIEEIKELWFTMIKYERKMNVPARSVSLPDALYLYLLIRHYKPKVVVELGTWIGTCTRIMLKAVLDNGHMPRIYTCDKRENFFDSPHHDKLELVHNRFTIYYHNCLSTKMLKKLSKDGVKIDFCFADAIFQKKDPALLKSLFKDKVIFATHDYKLPDDKGVSNIKKMKKELNLSTTLLPNPFELFGNKINSSIAILEES